MKRFLIALMALALLLTAVPALGDTGTLKLTLTGGSFDLDSARNMLALVNDLRLGDDAWYWNETDTEKIWVTGLSALTYDYALERVAMQRAAEIAVYYSHTRPDGSVCFSAYPSELRWTCGENIAYGQRDTEAVFVAWAEEDESYSGQGHRRNMLGGSFKSIGIGCYVCNGVRYWVQELSSQTTSSASNPLTLPVTLDVAEANISALSSGGDIILLEGEQVKLSDVSISSKGKSNWYAVPCKIEGMAWSIEDTSIATISNGAVIAKSKGTTNLIGTVGGLTATVRVKVGGGLPTIDVGVSGTLRLDDTSTTPNLVLDIPSVSGAERYYIQRRYQDNGQTCTNTVSYPCRVNFYIESLDGVHPIHMALTVTAVDESGEEIANWAGNVVLYPMSGVLWLPEQLRTIREEAFARADMVCAVVPQGCTAIGAKAFADCGRLYSVCIPASVTTIASDAFDGCDSGLVIVAPKGSKAAQLAQSKGYTWFESN